MRACKRDRNHSAIVAALRAAGVSVMDLGDVGKGCPDLLCGFMGKNFLLELKDGDAIPSAKRLNPAQKHWHATWRGQVIVVETIHQALRFVVLETIRGP